MGEEYFDREKEIDRIISQGPSMFSFVKDINPLFQEKALIEYFYSKIESADWLIFLDEAGVFSSPTNKIVDKAKGFVSHPIWQPSRLLARLVGTNPELTHEIIMKIPDSNNFFIHFDLAEAECKIDANLSKVWVQKEIKWIKKQNVMPYMNADVYGPLIENLASGGEHQIALKLTSVLLSITSEEKISSVKLPDGEVFQPRPELNLRIDADTYEEILKTYFLEAARHIGLPALALLVELLNSALDQYQRGDEDEHPFDMSYIWRISIDKDEPYTNDVKDILITAIKVIAIKLIRENKINIQEIIKLLDDRGNEWLIFYRISLYLLYVFRREHADSIREHLLNDNLFNEIGVRKEYNKILSYSFKNLNEVDKEAILGWAIVEDNREDVREWLLKSYEKEPTEEDIQNYYDRGKMLRIAPFKNDLPKKWQKLYKKWENKLGEVETTDPVTMGRTKIGYESPFELDDLRTKSNEEIIDLLNTWKPEGSYSDPSPEGLARYFSILVQEKPERFIPYIDQIKDLDVTYVHKFIIAYEELVRNGVKIEWEAILSLCKSVLEKPLHIENRRIDHHEMDPDWSWTHKSISRLLEEGFKAIEVAIPVKLKDRVWLIVESLVERDYRELDKITKTADKEISDAPSDALNDAHAIAVNLIVDYCKWLRMPLEEKRDFSFKDLPKAAGALERHLDHSLDDSIPVRSVFGRRLPWLVWFDYEWVKRNKDLFFPKDPDAVKFYNAVWNTYVTFNRGTDKVFLLLKKEYKIALEKLDQYKKGEYGSFDPYQSIVEHILDLYVTLQLKKYESMNLIDVMFAKAPVELREHAIAYMGRGLFQAVPDFDKDYSERIELIINLWEDRIKKAQESVEEDTFKEMLSFGWWFGSSNLDISWLIEQLLAVLKLTGGKVEPDHIVMKKLVKVTDDYPTETLESLILMIKGYSSEWSLRGWLPEVDKILKKIAETNDGSLIKTAIEITNLLGSLGFRQFRELHDALKNQVV